MNLQRLLNQGLGKWLDIAPLESPTAPGMTRAPDHQDARLLQPGKEGWDGILFRREPPQDWNEDSWERLAALLFQALRPRSGLLLLRWQVSAMPSSPSGPEDSSPFPGAERLFRRNGFQRLELGTDGATGRAWLLRRI